MVAGMIDQGHVVRNVTTWLGSTPAKTENLNKVSQRAHKESNDRLRRYSKPVFRRNIVSVVRLLR